jgi:uncharacterized protein (DUF885 family)
MRHLVLLVPSRPWLLGVLLAALAATPAGNAADGPPPAVAELHRLFAEEWERGLRENPTFASSLGDRRWNDRWVDLSLAAIAASYEEDRRALERLRSIDRASLPPSEQLNYDLFARRYERVIEGQRFRTFLMPVSQRGGVQTADELHEDLRFAVTRDWEDWIARLRALPVHVEQTTALMRQGMAEGRVPARVLMERVPEQIAAQVVESPEASPFYDPFEEFPEAIPEAERARLRAAARAAIAEAVVPAYRRFQAFFDGEYLPAGRASIAARDLPDGEAFYAYRVRSFTTTDLTPQQVHDIGLAEVARIRGEMEKVIAQVGFAGGFAEFLHFLRTDPRFYFSDPQELLAEYRSTTKRIDPELVKLFGRLPRSPYGVRPIPDTIAPDTTTAYYNQPAADGSRPGWYYVNLYKPETRPKYEIEVLSVHEAVPGHHLQIALQQELGELPAFRRFGGYTAFVEGWGLYSESLGEELGLYRDPYSKFGQLTYEMWRAVRLVVDTGMHQLGWSRERAIEYFKANAAKSELDIVNEIDRYISWPGQALAYKIGELKIKELRRRAEERLGERFDVRAFHDLVLGSGALPLDVLEQNVDAWIAAQAAG